ncbi:MAG: hypothetical protein AAF206_01435 [Bacteroidota bacterium]
MKVPAVQGIIDRRILITYKIDVNVLRKFLPAPFRPRVVDGYGIGGVDLLRQKQLRMRGLPMMMSLNIDSAFHRFAVEWDEYGQTRTGMYVPRRDTSSLMAVIASGRLFPGVQNLSRFRADDSEGQYRVSVQAKDNTKIFFRGRESDRFPFESVFDELDAASAFFGSSQMSYSPRYYKSIFNGLSLNLEKWEVSPMHVQFIRSTWLEDSKYFPKGSIYFDHALLMREVAHEWQPGHDIIAPRPVRVAGFLL